MIYLNPPEHLVLIFENFYCLPLFLNLNFELGFELRGFINSTRGDVASLAEFHCSLIIRASQPRKGESIAQAWGRLK